MPFRQGSLSVRRYIVTGEEPATFERTATMAMRRYEWKEINASRGEKESFGWINPRQPLIEQFTWEDIIDGPLVFLAVRRDRKSFSKYLFQARLAERIQEVKLQKSLERLTRQHRLALSEELTIQMLKETSPVSAFTEIIWDRNTGEVFMGATSNTLCERIADLFLSTFDLRLIPQFPALSGYSWLSEKGLETNYEKATYGNNPPPKPKASEEEKEEAPSAS